MPRDIRDDITEALMQQGIGDWGKQMDDTPMSATPDYGPGDWGQQMDRVPMSPPDGSSIRGRVLHDEAYDAPPDGSSIRGRALHGEADGSSYGIAPPTYAAPPVSAPRPGLTGYEPAPSRDPLPAWVGKFAAPDYPASAKGRRR